MRVMKCWMRRGRRQFYFISQLRKRRGGGGRNGLLFLLSPLLQLRYFFFASFPFFVGEEREGRRNKRRRGRRWWQQMTPQEKERRLVAIKVCFWASLGIFKRETMVGRREEERPTWKLYNTADSFKTFLKPQSFVLSLFLSRKKVFPPPDAFFPLCSRLFFVSSFCRKSWRATGKFGCSSENKLWAQEKKRELFSHASISLSFSFGTAEGPVLFPETRET